MDDSKEPSSISNRVSLAWDKVYSTQDLSSNKFIKDLNCFIFDLNHKSLFYSKPSADLFAMLKVIAKDMRMTIRAGSKLFRARRHDGFPGTPKEVYSMQEISAPPKDKVTTGRLNSEGIGFLYLAANARLAQLEVRSIKGAWSTVGVFQAVRDQTAIDISDVPDNFDDDQIEFAIYLDKLITTAHDGKLLHSRFTRWIAEFFFHQHQVENVVYSCALMPFYRINDRNICSFVPDAWECTERHLTQFEGVVYAV